MQSFHNHKYYSSFISITKQQVKSSNRNISKTSTAITMAPAQSAFQLASRLNGLDKPTVWHEFSPLAVEHNAVNLGQGFPDWDPPAFAIEAMNKSIDPSYGRNSNQYARSYAHLPLATVLAEDYSKRFGRDINPATEIATAVGCTNALFCALQGMVDDGDEVILLEPAFDVYISQTKMARGVPKFVPLRTKEGDDKELTANEKFVLDFDEFERAITEKSKVLILNTPHNPTGKMFNKDELEQLAAIIQRHPQVTVISDEVYEHIVFEPETSPHISIATIPGMYERTLTLSSSGKTFSATGWKIGWAVGPPNLVGAVTSVQQWVNFSAPTPNQDAIAQCLVRAREPYEGFDTFYKYVAAEYKRKRGLLMDALTTSGFNPIKPNGGFFIMAETKNIEFPKSYLDEKTIAMPSDPMPRDWAMSRWLTKEVGVTAIPPSAFYDECNIPLAKDLLRFAYCKGDSTILEAHKRLEEYFCKDEKN
jgi:kynurenine--oxoglutarate transaminase/cysteine-S-conjugate beta-lyase/glutamine--phenylpyruvate transaminase